ncbi:MAG TPA: hypothetical protein VJO12_02960 [Stellaceae bacterium]|nr:hypothetical protein [Stellaceae bacterium]
MITKVQLFLNMRNEGVARPLGVRRLRRAPECGQKFAVAVGRAVGARPHHALVERHRASS